MNQPRDTSDPSDPWESEMSRELDRRVSDLHEAPLSFEHVRSRAVTIRRKRRAAVAGSVLAAAAVIVPVAVLAGNGLGDTGRPVDPAQGPTASEASDPNDPTPTRTAVGSLGIPYLEGTTWHRADGSSVALDRRYDGGTVLGDDLLAVRNSNGRLTIDVVDGEGEVSESLQTFSYPVANDDHTTVAYVADDGTLMTRWADGQVAMGDGFADGDSVIAITGGPSCLEVEDGCVAYVNHGDGSAPEVLDSHGIRDVVVADALAVNDVAPDGRVAAQTRSMIDGSCSAVHDTPQREVVFETCDYSFDEFSPDGAHLSGADAYRDGAGAGYVVVLDATSGEEVARWEGRDGYAVTTVWEDDSHLLVNAYEDGQWRVYRLGVDGSVDEVLASSEGDDMEPAFQLLG